MEKKAYLQLLVPRKGGLFWFALASSIAVHLLMVLFIAWSGQGDPLLPLRDRQAIAPSFRVTVTLLAQPSPAKRLPENSKPLPDSQRPKRKMPERSFALPRKQILAKHSSSISSDGESSTALSPSIPASASLGPQAISRTLDKAGAAPLNLTLKAAEAPPRPSTYQQAQVAIRAMNPVDASQGEGSLQVKTLKGGLGSSMTQVTGPLGRYCVRARDRQIFSHDRYAFETINCPN